MENLIDQIFSKMKEEEEKILEASNKEQEEIESVKNDILNFDMSTLTEEEIKTADRMSEAFWNGLSDRLTPEQKGQIDNLTGRERLSLAGYVWGTINSAMLVNNIRNITNGIDIKGIVSKALLTPLSITSFGNVIYRAIHDFEDGATFDEVFSLLKDGGLSIISGAKFVYGMRQIMTGQIPGENFMDRFVNYYTDVDSVNIVKCRTVNSYTLNLDNGAIGLEKYLRSSEIADEIADGISMSHPTSVIDESASGFSLARPTNTIPDTGVPGTFKTLDGVDKPFNSLDLSYEIPKTRFERVKTFAGKAAGFAGIATDLAVMTGNIVSLVNKIKDGEEVLPGDITTTVGSALSLAGGIMALGGPVGQIAGLVTSCIGTLTNACSNLANLESNAPPEKVALAVTDLLTAFVPILPSPQAIIQALRYEKLLDDATGDVQKEVYGTYHTIASLNATPIINWFKFIYEGILKDGLHDDLREKFGSFTNIMTDYITNDSDFSNQINKIGEFLRNNEHTDYTQYITAYLTPDQMEKIFEDDADYASGVDIRNYHTKLATLKSIQYPVFTGTKFDILREQSGIQVFPVGKAYTEKDGRKVLDTISLGYGVGKNVQGARRIDTSTYLGYTKEALDMYYDELRKQHDLLALAKQTGVDTDDWFHQGLKGIPQEGWDKPRVWLDLIDDVSGAKVYNGVGENVNVVTEAGFDDRVHELVRDVNSHTYTGFKTLPSMNNRIRAVATDLIYSNIETKAGDDDVIFTDIVRRYTGADSIVLAKADGGEGKDILDISHMMNDDYKDETFDWKYSLDNNTFNVARNKNDGRDLNFNFQNFESIILGKGKNNIEFIGGTSSNSEIKEARIISNVASENNLNLSNIQSNKLIFESVASATNNITGSKNSDSIMIRDSNEGNDKKQIINGGEGNDFIRGGNVNKTSQNEAINDLRGGNGNDVIMANGNNSLINGDAGNDMLMGTTISGIEIMHGGDGNDFIQQSADSNAVIDGKYYGENGNDIIKLTNANSNSKIIVDGGEGNDTLDLSTLDIPNNIVMSCVDLRFDRGNYNQSIMQLNNIENIIGSNINSNIEMLFGSDKNNTIHGGDGNDLVLGNSGNDILYGDGGNDDIFGGEGYNILYGGKGYDKFSSNITTGLENSRIMDFESNEKIIFGTNNINDIDFERHRYRNISNGETIDSLYMIQNNNTIELYNFYNSGIEANKVDVAGGMFSESFDRNLVAEKIRNASSGNQGEISGILNSGAAPAPMVDYNDVNYAGLSSFSSNFGSVNF